MVWGKEDKTLIIGTDSSLGKDHTIVGIVADSKLNIIGESVELTISTEPWKSKTIQAVQIGDLAVYFGDEPDIGLVIHVPTLTRFDRAIPDGEWTQEQLLAWCWKVQQDNKGWWQYMADFNNKDYLEMDNDILNHLKDHCLGINPGD